jgi:hypothetical protein
MKTLANQSVERMAAGGRRFQIRLPGAAAIAHFYRSAERAKCRKGQTE